MIFTHIPVTIPAARMVQGHRYQTPTGTIYDSVTTILGSTKPAADLQKLDEWRKSVGYEVADYILQEASIVGTQVHKLNELYLCNLDDEGPYRLLSRAHHRNFRPFLDRIDRICGTEIILYSNKMSIAGTADCIAEYDNVPSVIDYKTKRLPQETGRIHDYFLQCSAYSMMYEELSGTHVGQAVVLVSSEKDTMQAFVADVSDYQSEFLERLKAYKAKNIARQTS